MNNTDYLRLSFRLSWRQLWLNRVFTVAMMVNMALGLIGYMVVDGFNGVFLREIAAKTKQIASADMIVSSRQAWSEAQKKIVSQFASDRLQISSRSSEVSVVTMASSDSGTRLVEARFIDDLFPLYPGITLGNGGPIATGYAAKLKSGDVWIFRELRLQLGIEIGSRLKIGDSVFTVADVVIDDPTTGVGGFSFAPRIFARLDNLQRTNLIGLGSRVLYIERFRSSNPSEIASDELKVLRRSLTAGDQSADIRVRSHKEVSEDLSRIQGYLNDYLSLIALVALFLAAVGTSYLMDGQLSRTTKEFAILSSLGAPPWIGPLVFVLQCMILGFGASLIAAMLGNLGMPFLARAMIPVAGAVKALWIPWQTIVRASLVAVLSGLALSLPRLRQLMLVKPVILLRGGPDVSSWVSWRGMVYYLPALLLWWLTSVHESKSWTTGTAFALVFLVIALALTALTLPLLRAARWSAVWLPMHWTRRLAVRQLSRNPVPTVSTFLALAIGASLISLIPQLQRVVSQEVARPESIIPQLFMFDIQDEQVVPLKTYMQSIGANLSGLAPMVRARLERVNGLPIDQRDVDFEGEREQKQREALQARTQNLSYRRELSSAESIIDGAFFSKEFSGQGVPGLSIEEGFAKRLNLKIGDQMRFDISGVEFEGNVTSIRKVRWTSFAPNFMILVQPGALNDAPKIWVASAGGVGSDKVDQIQMELVRQFSNVSVIDIKAAVSRLLLFIDKVGVAISVVAWLALMGGAGVLYAIAYARSTQRRWDMALVMALGGSVTDASLSVLVEYLIISSAAVVFGVFLGILESIAVARFVFDAPWNVTDTMISSWTFLIVPLSLFVSWLATRGALRVSVSQLLSEN